jgi:protein-tyrosine-phosphatase
MTNLRRSKMAEAIFEKLSGYNAMSAGIDPIDKTDENVVVALREIDVPIRDVKPKKISDSMLEWADKIVTFRCEDKIPKKYKTKVENWELGRKRNIGELPLDRTLDEIRKSRDLIYERVNKLVKELLNQNC